MKIVLIVVGAVAGALFGTAVRAGEDMRVMDEMRRL